MLIEIYSPTYQQKYKSTQGRLETLTDILILDGNWGIEVPRKIGHGKKSHLSPPWI